MPNSANGVRTVFHTYSMYRVSEIVRYGKIPA